MSWFRDQISWPGVTFMFGLVTGASSALLGVWLSGWRR